MQPAERPRKLSNLWLLPVFLLPLSLVLVLDAWASLHDRHHEMQDLADLVDDRIRDVIQTTQIALSMLTGYHRSAEFVDASGLTALLKTILEKNPAIHSISYQSWVPAEEKELFEQQTRQQGVPGYRIHAEKGHAARPNLLGGRRGYLPVSLIEPLTPGNAVLLGLDLLSLSPSNKAIREAIEGAAPASFGPVRGLGFPNHSLQWIQASYDGYRIPASVAERYRRFNGLFLIVVDLQELVKHLIPSSHGFEWSFIANPVFEPVQGAWKISDVLHLYPGSGLAQPLVLCYYSDVLRDTLVRIRRPVRFEELWSWAGLALALLAGSLASLFFLLWREQHHQSRVAALVKRDLDRERSRAQQTLQAIGDAVLVVDADWRVQYINPAAKAMLGISWPEQRGGLLGELVELRDAGSHRPLDDVQAYFMEQSQEGGSRQVCLVDHQGREIAIDSRVTQLSFPSGNDGTVIVIRYVSSERELTDRLAYQASHDMLTHLLNRSAFESRIRALLEESHAQGSRHAVIYLGLDRFKLINDTCGHAAGDELLKRVAGQIREVLRNDDILARLGGDEFGVLLRDCEPEVAETVAQRILESIEKVRFRKEDKVFQIHASIGVVPLHQETGSLKEVLMTADLACHVAKEQGRSRIHVHAEQDVHVERHHREMQWLPRLQEALDSDRFELFLQPVFPVSDESGLPMMNEFLIRLRGEDGRMLAPGLFIPSAERYGLMWQIDRWMVENAIAYLKDVETEREALYTINLSAQTFGDRAFAEFVEMTLESYGVDAGRVCFELTETAAITNIANASELMMALKDLGCSILLDDFGSGLSSFGYLKNLPIDYLKIDGQFVRDLTTDPLDEVMVRMCQELAKVLGVKTVAEFIENQEILEAVKAIGVDYAQGYHLARPRPAMQLVGEKLAAG